MKTISINIRHFMALIKLIDFDPIISIDMLSTQELDFNIEEDILIGYGYIKRVRGKIHINNSLLKYLTPMFNCKQYFAINCGYEGDAIAHKALYSDGECILMMELENDEIRLMIPGSADEIRLFLPQMNKYSEDGYSIGCVFLNQTELVQGAYRYDSNKEAVIMCVKNSSNNSNNCEIKQISVEMCNQILSSYLADFCEEVI